MDHGASRGGVVVPPLEIYQLISTQGADPERKV